MSDDRKYRQQGYRSQPSEPRRSSPLPRDMPRSGGMLASRSVSRCAACGAVLPVATASLEECPHCRAALHACRQCAHFDTARRFECTEPIPERIADKSARNDCAVFAVRVTLERETSPDSTRASDVRRGFDNLFKK